MDTISYAVKGDVTEVRLGKKHIGDIKKTKESNRYFYKAKGSKVVGEEFATVAEVQRSLEAE